MFAASFQFILFDNHFSHFLIFRIKLYDNIINSHKLYEQKIISNKKLSEVVHWFENKLKNFSNISCVCDGEIVFFKFYRNLLHIAIVNGSIISGINKVLSQKAIFFL